MTDYKKAAGDGIPQAASKSVYACYSNPIRFHLKAAIYGLSSWLFLLGALHG
jgi:hypothetical protein